MRCVRAARRLYGLIQSCMSASVPSSCAQVNSRMLGAILRDFLVVLEEYADASGVVVSATTADIDAM